MTFSREALKIERQSPMVLGFGSLWWVTHTAESNRIVPVQVTATKQNNIQGLIKYTEIHQQSNNCD